jgi:hypothetical protein
MASGNSLLKFTPREAEFPAANFATHGERNNHPILNFDASTEEACYFTSVLPRHYAGGGLTIYLHYSMASAVANAIVLGTSIERIGDQQQDLDDDGFATEQVTASTTVPATSGLVDIVTTVHTAGANMDGLAVGETFRLKVARKVADAGDTATGDLELVAIEIKET